MTEHDNNEGGVETYPNNQDNNEDASSVAGGFVVPDDGSGGNSIALNKNRIRKVSEPLSRACDVCFQKVA